MTQEEELQVVSIANEAFLAGQESMRNRAAVRAGAFLSITDPENVRLGAKVAEQILGMEIISMGDRKKRANETFEETMQRIVNKYAETK